MRMSSSELTVTLPSSLAEEVRAAATAHGVSPDEYVQQTLAADVLFSAVDDDEEAMNEALEASAEFERTGMGVPLDDVRAWMKSWGKRDELPPPTLRKLR